MSKEQMSNEEARVRKAAWDKANADFASKHDRLCPNSAGSCCPWLPQPCDCQCMCDFIKEVRDDQKRLDAEAIVNRS